MGPISLAKRQKFIQNGSILLHSFILGGTRYSERQTVFLRNCAFLFFIMQCVRRHIKNRQQHSLLKKRERGSPLHMCAHSKTAVSLPNPPCLVSSELCSFLLHVRLFMAPTTVDIVFIIEKFASLHFTLLL